MDIKIRNKFIEIKNCISDWFIIKLETNIYHYAKHPFDPLTRSRLLLKNSTFVTLTSMSYRVGHDGTAKS